MKRFLNIIVLLSFITAQLPAIEVFAQTNANQLKPADPLANVNVDPQVVAQQNKMAAALAELENAGENDLPKQTKDIFSLTQQKLVVHSDRIKTFNRLSAKGQTFSLMSDNLPLVVSTDFENEVTIEVDRAKKEIHLQFWKNNQHLATHIISGFDVVASARDKEFYTFLDKSGKIYTFDAGLARDISFRAPIPVFQVAEMEPSLVKDHLKATFRTRGGLPTMTIAEGAVVPMDLPETSIYRAGSFDIYDPISKQYLGIYDRQGLRAFTYIGEAILNLLAATVNPSEKPLERFESIHSSGGEKQVSEMINTYLQSLDPAMVGMLRGLSPAFVQSLTNRSNHNRGNMGENLDRFKAQENTEARNQIARAFEAAEKINLADADMQNKYRGYLDKSFHPKVYKTLIERLKEPKSLKIIGAIVAGTVTVGTAYALWNGVGPAWAINFVHQAYDNYFPAALKHEGYRSHSILSGISIWMFMPLIYVIGASYSKIKGLQMDPIKATVKMGLVIWGSLILPAFHYFAKIADQPNFVEALQRGINPFKKQEIPEHLQNNGEKTAYPAFNTYKKNPDYVSETERNAKLIKFIYDKRAKRRALSHSLALLAVSQKEGVDPVTIQMVQDNLYTAEQIEQMASDKSFRLLWLKSAKQLEAQLMTIEKVTSGAFSKDISEIDEEAFNKGLEEAQRAVKKVKRYSRIPFRDLLVGWRNMGTNLVSATGRYAVEENQFLTNNDPSEFVKKQFFLQFTVDYTLAVPQITYWGARADLDNAPYLAATPTDDLLQRYVDKHPGSVWDKAEGIIKDAAGKTVYDHSRYYLWSNPQHLGSMADQVRIYALNANAATAMVYGKQMPVYEDNYSPIENLMYKGIPRAETVLSSTWNFIKDAVNIKKSKYGYLWMKQIIKRTKVLQATTLFIVVERIMMAGQNPIDAALSFGISFFGASLLYWFFLWDPVQMGMQMRDGRLEVALEKLLSARTSLSQAARFGSDKDLANEYLSFMEFYNNQKEKMQPPQELVQFSELMKEYVKTGSNSMGIDLRKAAETATVKLLNHSSQKPPIATKENAAFNWGLMTAVSIATTLAATYLDVMTYSSGREGLVHNLIYAFQVFALVYPSAYLLQKLLDKYDSRVEALDSFDKIKSDFKSKYEKNDQEAAKSYLKALDLYKAYERGVPKALSQIREDLSVFVDSNQNEMPEVLKDYFEEAAKDFAKFMDKYPAHNPETYDTTVWDNALMDKYIRLHRRVKKAFNNACSGYIRSIGEMFKTR